MPLKSLQQKTEENPGNELADQCWQLGTLRKFRERACNHEQDQDNQQDVQCLVLPGRGVVRPQPVIAILDVQ